MSEKIAFLEMFKYYHHAAHAAGSERQKQSGYVQRTIAVAAVLEVLSARSSAGGENLDLKMEFANLSDYVDNIQEALGVVE